MIEGVCGLAGREVVKDHASWEAYCAVHDELSKNHSVSV